MHLAKKCSSRNTMSSEHHDLRLDPFDPTRPQIELCGNEAVSC